jgi:hypothetical protein
VSSYYYVVGNNDKLYWRRCRSDSYNVGYHGRGRGRDRNNNDDWDDDDDSMLARRVQDIIDARIKADRDDEKPWR